MQSATVQESTSAYSAHAHPNSDIPARLDELQAEVHNMRGKIDTLLALLGGPLRASLGIGDDKPTDKAG